MEFIKGVGRTVTVNVFASPIQPAVLVGTAVITSDIFPPVKFGEVPGYAGTVPTPLAETPVTVVPAFHPTEEPGMLTVKAPGVIIAPGQTVGLEGGVNTGTQLTVTTMEDVFTQK